MNALGTQRSGKVRMVCTSLRIRQSVENYINMKFYTTHKIYLYVPCASGLCALCDFPGGDDSSHA